jgi:hypothetical protein
LLAVNIPTLKKSLAADRGGKCNHNKHTEILRGRGPDAKYLTAPAKQYPQDMCKVIAFAAFDFVQQKVPPEMAEGPLGRMQTRSSSGSTCLWTLVPVGMKMDKIKARPKQIATRSAAPMGRAHANSDKIKARPGQIVTRSAAPMGRDPCKWRQDQGETRANSDKICCAHGARPMQIATRTRSAAPHMGRHPRK